MINNILLIRKLNMKKLLKVFGLTAVAIVGMVTTASAQVESNRFGFDEATEVSNVVKTTGSITTGELNPLPSTYVFGSVGSTTNGKSSTVTTIGVGQDIFYFADKHVIVGIEGAFTHFTGKTLKSINNDGTVGYSNINKNNLIEVGAKLSYQFDELTPLNVRAFGKAGYAVTSLSKISNGSPFIGAGLEFNVKGSDLVWVLDAKHYTDLRKANVFFDENKSSRFNTRKSDTVVGLGLQYRF